MEHKFEQEHELITFSLSSLDKLVVRYCVISCIILMISLDWLMSFEGVWIWGMPKSVFGIFLVGVILNAIVIFVLYFAYRSYFDKLEK